MTALDTFPKFSVASDIRAVQVALTERLAEITDQATKEGMFLLLCFRAYCGIDTMTAELPMLYVYTTLQEFEQQLLEEEESTRTSELERTPLRERNVRPAPAQVRLKSALLWSHHLLANSKRKDISHWSVELKVWAIAKIGSVTCAWPLIWLAS